ncbi:hypothetical protein MASR1M48_16990 [Lactococcus petauri]
MITQKEAEAAKKIEEILKGFLDASYGNRKLPFNQYKVIRETFLAGMIAGFRNTVEISLNPSEEEAEDLLTINSKVIEKLAIDSAWAKFPFDPNRCDENFESDRKKWIEVVRHHNG